MPASGSPDWGLAHSEAGDAEALGEKALLERDAGISEGIGHMAVIALWIGY